MTPAGFPHSDISGSKSVCDLPELIAAYHVLRRLLVPRHPPCALSSLTEFLTKVLQSVATHVSYSIVKDRARRSGVAKRDSYFMNPAQDLSEDPGARRAEPSLVFWWR